MAQRQIVWTRTADIQLAGILEYWVGRTGSKNYSLGLLDEVRELTAQIASSPHLFKKTDHKDIRVASMGNFSIYYLPTNELLVIMAFWDNRQDPKKLLKILSGRN